MGWLLGENWFWLVLAALLGALVTLFLTLRKVEVSSVSSRGLAAGAAGAGVVGGVGAATLARDRSVDSPKVEEPANDAGSYDSGTSVDADPAYDSGTSVDADPAYDSGTSVDADPGYDAEASVDADPGYDSGTLGAGAAGAGAGIGAASLAGAHAGQPAQEPSYDADTSYADTSAEGSSYDTADTSLDAEASGADTWSGSDTAAAGLGAGAVGGAGAAAVGGAHAADREPVEESTYADAGATDSSTADAGASAPAAAASIPQGPHGAGSADPLEGGASPGGAFSIKGNADSMKYHTQESPYFGRTVAEVWFDSEDAARGAGFVRWDQKSGDAGSAAFASIPEGPHGAGSADPLEGGASPGGAFSIKGNADSMKYHTDESPYFGRTVAEVWFDSEEAAQAAGFARWDAR